MIARLLDTCFPTLSDKVAIWCRKHKQMMTTKIVAGETREGCEPCCVVGVWRLLITHIVGLPHFDLCL